MKEHTERLEVSFYIDVKLNEGTSMEEVKKDVKKDIKSDLCGVMAGDYTWEGVKELKITTIKR